MDAPTPQVAGRACAPVRNSRGAAPARSGNRVAFM